MPTGYTAPVEDGTITTLEEYGLRCARAFGWCIGMREESLSRPPPTELKPDAYHKNALKAAERALVEAEALTDDAADKATEKAHKREIVRHAERKKRHDLEESRYRAMHAKVTAWKPAPGYTALRNMMLEQLETCMDTDGFFEKYYSRKPKRETGQQYKARAIKVAKRDIADHRKEYAKEVKAAREGTKWLRGLRDALKGEAVEAPLAQ